MNLEKLSSAPWEFQTPRSGDKDIHIHGPRITVDYDDVDHEQQEANAEFVVLARQAFQIMIDRMIYPVFFADHWGVRVGRCTHVRGDNPFSAIIDADRWMKENSK